MASGLRRISWRAVRFDQDVELVLTGKLIVEISLGGPAAAGRTICSNLTWSGRTTWGAVVGPAGPLAAGDHLQRDRSRSYKGVKIEFTFFLLIYSRCGAPASRAAQHTTVCLDVFICMSCSGWFCSHVCAVHFACIVTCVWGIVIVYFKHPNDGFSQKAEYWSHDNQVERFLRCWCLGKEILRAIDLMILLCVLLEYVCCAHSL